MRKVVFLIVITLLTVVSIFPAAAPEVVEASPSASWGVGPCASVSLENPSTPECEAFIAANPEPDVSVLPTDYGVVADETFIRFNKNNVPVYNAPGGAQIDTLITGYTYVTPLAFKDGYAQLGRNRWVSMEDARMTRPSAFSGVQINGLNMPFAWVLWRHNAADAPAGQRDSSRRVQRYELVNIYATINIRGWDWHLIGPGMWTNQQNLSIVSPGAPTSEFGGRWVAVDLYEQNLVAYEGTRPVFATLVSSGLKNGKWDTHEGTFTVGTRVVEGTMNGAEGREDYYSLEKVPYAQYFDGLISLHGTYWHDSFGYPQSHGCVNLSITDAKWLYDSWLNEGDVVYVY